MTIQNLIGSGMDPKTENNPYLGFIYTSFQARAAALWAGRSQQAGPPAARANPSQPLRLPSPPPLPLPLLPQERATKVSHGNTARMAAEYGDDVLGKVCGAIAADESRHEIAYTRIVDEFFRWVVGGWESIMG